LILNFGSSVRKSHR